MTARWMQVKMRKLRVARRKRPAKYDPFMLRDIYGKNSKQFEPDTFDEVEPDRRKQRAWINQQRIKTRQEQLLKPRPGVPQDIWYKIIKVNLPDFLRELWFSCNKFYLREVRFGVERKSSVYPSKETLMSDLDDGLLVWRTSEEEHKT